MSEIFFIFTKSYCYSASNNVSLWHQCRAHLLTKKKKTPTNQLAPDSLNISQIFQYKKKYFPCFSMDVWWRSEHVFNSLALLNHLHSSSAEASKLQTRTSWLNLEQKKIFFKRTSFFTWLLLCSCSWCSAPSSKSSINISLGLMTYSYKPAKKTSIHSVFTNEGKKKKIPHHKYTVTEQKLGK